MSVISHTTTTPAGSPTPTSTGLGGPPPPSGPSTDERAEAWGRDQLARLRRTTTERLADLVQQRREGLGNGNGAGVADIGTPIVNQYVAFDIAVTSPIQFDGPPPYQPSKIIAGGGDAYIFVYMLVNPAVSVVDGFAVPPATQLGGRRWRIRLEQLNLSQVTNGPDQTRTGVFGSPAESLTFTYFKLDTPDPGPNPRLVEVNVTADIEDRAQPYAAFASGFFDIDNYPEVFVPAIGAGFRYQIPNRYLVFSQ